MAKTKRKVEPEPDYEPDVGDPLDDPSFLEPLPDENAEEDYGEAGDFKFEYPSLLDDPADFDKDDEEEEEDE